MTKGKYKSLITSVVVGLMLLTTCIFGAGALTPKRTARAAAGDLPEWAPLIAGVWDEASAHINVSGYTYDNNVGYKYTYLDNGSPVDTNPAGFVDKSDPNMQNLKPKESGSYVMLNNYVVQNNLINGSTSECIESMYVGVGYKDTFANPNQLINSLTVTAYLSNDYIHNTYGKDAAYTNYDSSLGMRIKVNDVQSQDTEDGTQVNRYWSQYFDLTQIYVLEDPNQSDSSVAITETEGLYTLTFAGQYLVYNATTSSYVSQPFNVTYSFYLFDNKSYVDYPTFNSSVEYVKGDHEKSSTNFYNFQDEKLPTLLYNASKYNISYTRSYSTTLQTFTTDFIKIDGVGRVNTYLDGQLYDSVTIHLDSTNNIITYKRNNTAFATLDMSSNQYELNIFNNVRQELIVFDGASGAEVDYYYFAQFNELGKYELTYQHIFGIKDDHYITLPETPVNILQNMYIGSIYNKNDLYSSGTYENGFLNLGGQLDTIPSNNDHFDNSIDGVTSLRLFGVKAVFFRTGTTDSKKYDMEDVKEGIYADQTTYLSSRAIQAGLKITGIPSTNLQPIYFDYLGKYAYTTTGSGTVPTSTVYKVERSGYTVNNGEYTITDASKISTSSFTKDTTLPLPEGVADGLYIIEANYTYDLYDDPSVTHTQYFAIEINNIAPNITVNAGSAGNMNELSGTAYTNQQYLTASWEDPNYFQGEVYTSIKHYPYSATGVNYDIVTTISRYEKGTYINVQSGQTAAGLYEITLHYGLNSENNRTIQIHVDRSPVQYQAIGVDVATHLDESNAHIIYGNTSTVLTNNITSSMFMITHQPKPSGADVTIKYRAIPFGTNTSYASQLGHKLSDGVITNMFVNTLASSTNVTTNYYYYVGDETNTETVGDWTGSSIRPELVFGRLGNSIYEIIISDAAGNSSTYYYIYDTTMPHSVLLDEGGNEFISENGLVNANTTIYFGDYKYIPVTGTHSIITNLSLLMTGSKWLGSQIVKIGTDEYIKVPLSGLVNKNTDYYRNKAYVQLGSEIVTPNTAATQSFNIYKSKVTPVQPWSGVNNSTVDTSVFFGYQNDAKTYYWTINDILANNNTSFITMNLDKAQFLVEVTSRKTEGVTTTELTQENISLTSAGKAYNIVQLISQFNSQVQIGAEGSEQTVGTQISYSYYPFALETYLSKGVTYPTYTGETDDKYNRPIPNYPFARSSAKNYTLTNADGSINGNKFISNPINVISSAIAEGMYVFKRIYTGITEDQFLSTGEEDDVFVRYYVAYVDRHGIIDIVSTYENPLDHVNSIGNQISMLLGAELGDGSEEYQYTVDADTIITLLNNLGEQKSSPIITTNKVKVQLNSTDDKWATSEKLLDNSLTDYSYDNLGNEVVSVQNKTTLASQVRNNSIFKLNLNLSYTSEHTGSSEKLVYLVRNGVPQTGASIDDIREILLHEENTYKLELFDNSGIDVIENGILKETNANCHAIAFYFRISYERPQGSFSSYYDGQVQQLTVNADTSTGAGIVNFHATNSDSLLFDYSDSVDYTQATVDNTYLLVESKSGELSSANTWTTILRVQNGVATTIPSGLILDDIWSKTLIDGTDNLYSYRLKIFDKESALNLANPDSDASYRVTLRFMGDSSYYTTSDGESYYTNSFQIYVDHTNPQNNLATLIANDKTYTGQNLEKYFFAINNGVNGTIFDGSNINDSYELYLRPLGTNFPTDYKQSVVNGAEAPSPQHPVFDIYNENYIRCVYDNNKQFNFASDSAIQPDNGGVSEPITNGYYEIVERDRAGNCTVYAALISNNDNINMQLSYTLEGGETPDPCVIPAGTPTNVVVIETKSLAYSLIDVAKTEVYDKYVKIDITADGGISQTLYSDPYTKDTDEWFADVLDIVQDLVNNNIGIYDYTLTITNRFGEDYQVTITFPGKELELDIYDNTGASVKVRVPRAQNRVNINYFYVFRYNNGIWDLVGQDVDKSINTYNENRITDQIYTFGPGQYKFEIIDNVGRSQEYYAYVGTDADSQYYFNYGKTYITDAYDVVHTSTNPVILDIDSDLWNVTILVAGEDSPRNFYNETYNALTKRTTFSFNKAKRYTVQLSWATGTEADVYEYTFVINDAKPTATFTDVNGKELIVETNTLSTFTRNFYISFNQGDYGVNATLYNGKTTIAIDTNHLINEPATYTLTLTNNIGATNTYKFVRENNNYTYYSVVVKGTNGEADRVLSRSDYTTTNVVDGLSVHNYYLLDTEENRENVQIVVDGNEGYNFGIISQGDSDLYSIYKLADNPICYVQINFVDENTSFGAFTMQIGSTGSENNTFSQKTIVTLDNLGNKFDKVILRSDSKNEFDGNYISIDYYYNNVFVRTITASSYENKIEFEMTRAGLHSFVAYDIAGNIRLFDGMQKLDIYLLNNVVYRVNGTEPIQHQVFNSKVDISIIRNINGLLYEDDIVEVTAMRNNKSYTPAVVDKMFRFVETGFYTVTMTTKVDGNTIVTTYDFVITYEDDAHLSFSLPSSYGFTLNKVYLNNNADVSHLFTDRSSLWLSVGDTGSGMYTIVMSHYNPETLTSTEFTFKVWINEETPTIIPIDYTYGTKTSGRVSFQYSGKLIYEQIGNARVVVIKDGHQIYSDPITSSSGKLTTYTIGGTKDAAGTYYIRIYNSNDQLVVSYKVIKTVPLNSSAKIIIICVSIAVAAGVVIFIILRRHTKFR